MSFKELLEKYSSGTATEEEKRLVEEELEKYEAISDFQYERIEKLACGFEGEQGNGEPDIQSGDISESEGEFVRRIRKEIRRIFVKTGIAIGAAVVAIVLFITFALPSIVSLFYYDPAEIVARSEEDGIESETNRMSLDMAVYTELVLPEARRNYVQADDNKYGRYNICIGNYVWYGKESQRDISGEVVRGKLNLYDTNALRTMPGNEFGWYQRKSTELALTQQDKLEAEEWKKENPGEDGTILHGASEPESSEELLNELNDGEECYVYVTLNEMMKYEDFYKFYSGFEDLRAGWCAVKTNEAGDGGTYFNADNIGFAFNSSAGSMLDWDKEKYPDLFLKDQIDEESEEKVLNFSKEENVKDHFLDMLEYIGAQKQFIEMITPDTEYDFDGIKSYVEENGITVYGFVALADKETLSELVKNDMVYSIDTKSLYAF